MKIRFFPHQPPQTRKNDLRISFISHDRGSAYTLPTPKNSLWTRTVELAWERRSKRHDA